jgi:hypothetical protein
LGVEAQPPALALVSECGRASAFPRIFEVLSPMYSLPKNVYRERKDFSKI